MQSYELLFKIRPQVLLAIVLGWIIRYWWLGRLWYDIGLGWFGDYFLVDVGLDSYRPVSVALYSKIGSDRQRVLLVGLGIDCLMKKYYVLSGWISVISDEACFGLVYVGVSYRSDYSYQKHICVK